MKSVLVTGALVAALALAGAAVAKGPITKQNGSAPVIAAFTPICAVAGYADYGYCGGDVTTFAGVGGRMNAVQPKPGRYNLDFTFTNLTPGVEYRLWATRDDEPYGGAWSEVGRAPADESGSVRFTLTTDQPAGLGFDLNTVRPNVTVVTSFWSGQRLVVNADGTLATA